MPLTRMFAQAESNKLIKWLFFAGVCLLGIYFFSQHQREQILVQYDQDIQNFSNLQAEKISRRIDDLRRDVLVLAHSNASKDLLGSINSLSLSHPVDDHLNPLREMFVNLAKSRPDYWQIRLIGVADSGKELVRIDNRGGEIFAVENEYLQKKGERDYFQSSIQLQQGQVYLSPINLNREHGTVEYPFRPTIRAATPLFASDGQPFGVVVINLELQGVFREIESEAEAYKERYKGQLYLANENGDWLIHPDSNRTFGTDLGVPYTVDQDFGNLNQTIELKNKNIRLQTALLGNEPKLLSKKSVSLVADQSSRALQLIYAFSEADLEKQSQFLLPSALAKYLGLGLLALAALLWLIGCDGRSGQSLGHDPTSCSEATRSQLSIRSKISLALFLVGIFASVSVSLIALGSFKAAVEEETKSHLSSLASYQHKRVQEFIDHNRLSLRLVASRTQLRLSLQAYQDRPDQILKAKIERILSDARQSVPFFKRISVTNLNGVIVASTDPELLGQKAIFARRGDFDPVTELFIDFKPGSHLQLIQLSMPMLLNGERVGYATVDSSTDGLTKITQDYAGLGETGETLIAEKLSNGDAHFLTMLRFEQVLNITRTIPAIRQDVPIVRALNGEFGFHSNVVDYREQPVFAVTTFLAETGWGVLTKIDQEEAFQRYNHLQQTLFKIVIVFLLVTGGVSFLLSRSISRPIEDLTGVALGIKQGDRSLRAKPQAYDRETAMLASAFNDMTHELMETFDAVPNGIVMVNADGDIVRCNGKLEKMFGYQHGELLGQNVDCLLPEHLRKQHGEHLRQYFQLPETRVMGGGTHLMARRKDGSLFPVEVGLSPVEVSPQTLILSTVMDISERRALEHQVQEYQKNLERTVEERTQELVKALDAAEIATRAKSEFLAKMSHEIRTPMNAIIGLIYLLLQENMTAKQRLQLKKVDSAAHSLLGIINDILDYSKIEAGKMEIELVPFNLEAVIDNIANVSSAVSREKDIEVLVHKDKDVPIHLVGDPLRLGQVLLNLMNNAIKFTDSGLVSLNIKLAEHKTVQNSNEIWLSFIIRDSGIGMDQATLDTIFKPFEQADGSITRRFGGTGLGLAIVQQLSNLMQGEIQVESLEGDGTTFSVNFPFRQSEVKINYRSYDHYSFSNLRVLIVDDSPEARETMTTMIDGFGCYSESASSGEEGIELFRVSLGKGEPFNIVLMDWRLPGMDGLTAARCIKEMAPKESVPVIILETAYGRELLDEHDGTSQVDGLLTKPVTSSCLFDAIIQLIAPEDSGNCERDQLFSTQMLQGMKILLVEDHLINQEVACSMLEGGGAQVSVANNGQEALDLLAEQPDDFHAILMDVQMPVMDGLEATKAIRANEHWQSLPIIAMTANASLEDRDASMAVGMDAYLTKPVNVEKLFNTLSNWYPLSHINESVVASQAMPEKSDSVPDSDSPLSERSEAESVSESELFTLGSVPGINIHAALGRLNKDNNLLLHLMEKLLQQGDECALCLRGRFNKEHPDRVKELLHGLKGTSGNLAAEALHQATTDLHQAFMAGNKVDASLEHAFLEALDELKTSYLILKNKFEKQVCPLHELGMVSKDERLEDNLRSVIVALREALSDQEMIHDKQLRLFSEMIASADNEEQYKQQLSDFCESVYELDYGRALELLDQLEILSKQATEE